MHLKEPPFSLNQEPSTRHPIDHQYTINIAAQPDMAQLFVHRPAITQSGGEEDTIVVILSLLLPLTSPPPPFLSNHVHGAGRLCYLTLILITLPLYSSQT